MGTEYKSTPLHRLPPNFAHVTAVSYTHLDVYKRQDYSQCNCLWVIEYTKFKNLTLVKKFRGLQYLSNIEKGTSQGLRYVFLGNLLKSQLLPIEILLQS